MAKIDACDREIRWVNSEGSHLGYIRPVLSLATPAIVALFHGGIDHGPVGNEAHTPDHGVEPHHCARILRLAAEGAELALVSRRHDAAHGRDWRQARGRDGPESRGRLGHPFRRPVSGAARGAARAQKADPRPRDPRDRAGRQQCRFDRGDVSAHAWDEPRARRSRGLARDEDDAGRGGHPDYKVLADESAPGAARLSAQQDPWHYTIARMVDACAANGIKPFYGPFGDFSDPVACEAQFRNAFLLGCAGAWTLHPSQIAIAKRVFSPDPAEVAFAHKILTAMPDGSGAVMIDGKMQDDATWKQAKVIVELAKQVAAKDAEYAAIYRF